MSWWCFGEFDGDWVFDIGLVGVSDDEGVFFDLGSKGCNGLFVGDSVSKDSYVERYKLRVGFRFVVVILCYRMLGVVN